MSEAPPAGQVRAPGCHADGIEVSAGEFVENVLARIPAGELYRRDRLLGVVSGGRWHALNATQLRPILDAHVRLERVEQRGEAIKRTIGIFTEEIAKLVLEVGGASPRVRKLRAIAEHPVIGPKGTVLWDGWHEEHGLLIECPLPFQNAEPFDPRELLHDFDADQIGKDNWILYLLSVMARPCLNGDVPLFLFTAPVSGGGKSFLANKIAGNLLYGREIPTTGWPADEDEVEKKILAMALSGSPVIALDNVNDNLDSGALARFVTSGRIEGRFLTRSQMVSVDNVSVVAITGINTYLSGELARRGVTIALGARRAPEALRFKFVLQEALRPGVRGGAMRWLANIVEAYAAAGCPDGGNFGMGGFEAWSRRVASVAKHAGLRILEDEAYRRAKNDDNEEPAVLVEKWYATHGDVWVSSDELLTLVDAAKLYRAKLGAGNEHARRIRMGFILRAIAGREIHGQRIIAERGGDGMAYRLCSV